MKTLLSAAVLIFIIVFGTFITVELLPESWISPDRARNISDSISSIAAQAWTFVRPLLQFAIIVLLVQGLLAKVSNSQATWANVFASDIRGVLAVLVVISFCVGSLAGVAGESSLKDAALVVIGFYFGRSRNRHEDSPEPGSTSSNLRS